MNVQQVMSALLEGQAGVHSRDGDDQWDEGCAGGDVIVGQHPDLV